MTVSAEKVGKQILDLRKAKNITQAELGERLGVSFQAVSKWERGETLPDISLLADLANILETTIDNILLGGQRITDFKRKITVEQVKDAFASLSRLGDLLGKDNLFYLAAIDGINSRMNMDIESYLQDEYTKEAMLAEAIVQCLQNGAYIDISDVKRGFVNPHWQDIVISYAQKHGIK